MVLSAFDVLAHLAFVLELMGIVIASMGATVLTAFFLKTEELRLHGICWLLGVIAGILALSFQIGLTKVPILDACLVSGSILLLKNRFFVMQEVSS